MGAEKIKMRLCFAMACAALLALANVAHAAKHTAQSQAANAYVRMPTGKPNGGACVQEESPCVCGGDCCDGLICAFPRELTWWEENQLTAGGKQPFDGAACRRPERADMDRGVVDYGCLARGVLVKEQREAAALLAYGERPVGGIASQAAANAQPEPSAIEGPREARQLRGASKLHASAQQDGQEAAEVQEQQKLLQVHSAKNSQQEGQQPELTEEAKQNVKGQVNMINAVQDEDGSMEVVPHRQLRPEPGARHLLQAGPSVFDAAGQAAEQQAGSTFMEGVTTGQIPQDDDAEVSPQQAGSLADTSSSDYEETPQYDKRRRHLLQAGPSVFDAAGQAAEQQAGSTFMEGVTAGQIPQDDDAEVSPQQAGSLADTGSSDYEETPQYDKRRRLASSTRQLEGSRRMLRGAKANPK